MQPHINLLIAPSLAASSVPEEYKTQSADVHHVIVDTMGINDARALVSATSQKSVGGGEHIFVIVFSAITIETQNALLKLFEEPPEHTILYVVIPHESLLIPTLRSRFITVSETASVTETNIAKEFLTLGYGERMTLIAEKAKQKDVQWMELIVGELGLKYGATFDTEGKKALRTVDSYIRIRGASRKMLLEHLALSAPVA